MNGLELFCSIIWLALVIPVVIEMRRRRRKIRAGEEPAVGINAGCYYFCMPLVIIGALLIIAMLISSYQFKQPENMLERYLGVTDPSEVTNLTSRFEDLTFDHAAYLYFEAEETVVRRIIADGGFVESPSFGDGLSSFRGGFEEAPPVPTSEVIVYYHREEDGKTTSDTLITDAAHQRVWFSHIDY